MTDERRKELWEDLQKQTSFEEIQKQEEELLNKYNSEKFDNKFFKKVMLNSYYGAFYNDSFQLSNSDFKPKKTLQSRYADKIVNPRYYAKMKIEPERKGKQIFSENDPYGEELWEE